LAPFAVEAREPLGTTAPVNLGEILSPPPVVVPVAPPAEPPMASPRSEGPAPSQSRSDMLLDIVAEKTGYPREALDLAMDLESDLGVDSIKRVEILAAANDRIPDLPRLQTERLAAMRTLAQIAAYIDSASLVEKGAQPRPRSEMLLDIVAEKTGYPREALDLTMDLESDLGIDSIKRVEILAAASDRIPDLPRLQTERLAAMRTLAQIAAYIDSAAHGNGKPHPMASAPNGPPMLSPSEPKAEGRRAGALIERWVPALHDAPAPGFAVTELRDGEPLFVLRDPGGVGRALAARLGREGIRAEVAETLPPAARRIVLLGSPTAASLDEALAMNRDMLSVVASRAPAWERAGGLLVAVEHGEDAAARGTDAWLGGLAALCRTAKAELPRLTAKAIRLHGGFHDADALAGAIGTELLTGGTDAEVHLAAGGRRRIARLEARVLVPGDLPVAPGSVVVVSGGARGITAEALLALAHRVELRLLLLGRTRLGDEPDWSRGIEDVAELGRRVLEQARARGEACSPSDVRAAVARIGAAREVSDVLARLRAAGSEGRYASADIADARAVADAVGAARRDWGPIAGFVHGAGALADAWLRDKEPSHVERVFAPKLRGLANLLAATADDPLRFICIFSSVVAHSANPGQADYAMANSILERVCAAEAARRGPSCRVQALAWGPWDGGMVTPQLREKFARAGVRLIDKRAGSEAFVRELCGRGIETTIGLTVDAPGVLLGDGRGVEVHPTTNGSANRTSMTLDPQT
jgi:acyl carrier protein